MVGNLLLTLFNLENIKRYQTRKILFPRTVSAHSISNWYSATILGLMEESVFNKKIDWKTNSCQNVFHDGSESNSGDILSPTKNYTKEMKIAYEKVEKLMFENEFLDLIPKSWQTELQGYFLDPKDDTIIGQLVTAADHLDVIFECRTELMYLNNCSETVFLEILQSKLISLSKSSLESVQFFIKYALPRLNLERFYPIEFEKHLENIHFSDEIVQEYSVVGELLLTLFKLDDVNRYVTKKVLFPRSYAEHTTAVFFNGYCLGQWTERKFGKKIDWKKLTFKLGFHDSIYSITGSFMHNTANYNTEIKEEIKNLKMQVFENEFTKLIPKSFQEELKKGFLQDEQFSIEDEIVLASNYIDRVFECRTQLSYLNPDFNEEFKRILIETLDYLKDIDNDAVRYFLKYPLQDLNISKYYTDSFRSYIDSIQFNESHFENKNSIIKEAH